MLYKPLTIALFLFSINYKKPQAKLILDGATVDYTLTSSKLSSNKLISIKISIGNLVKLCRLVNFHHNL